MACRSSSGCAGGGIRAHSVRVPASQAQQWLRRWAGGAVAGMDHGHGRSDPSIDDDDLMRARPRPRAPPLLRPVAAAWPNQPSAAGVVSCRLSFPSSYFTL
jgi:hypothetical protein